jgi:hypothetical protein
MTQIENSEVLPSGSVAASALVWLLSSCACTSWVNAQTAVKHPSINSKILIQFFMLFLYIKQFTNAKIVRETGCSKAGGVAGVVGAKTDESKWPYSTQGRASQSMLGDSLFWKRGNHQPFALFGCVSLMGCYGEKGRSCGSLLNKTLSVRLARPGDSGVDAAVGVVDGRIGTAFTPSGRSSAVCPWNPVWLSFLGQ